MTNLLSLQINGNSVKDWMNHYGHEVVDGQIKVNGQIRKIEDVAQQIINPKTHKISSDWRYDSEGLHDISFIKFQQLVPTNSHIPDGKNYLVIKTKEKGFFGLSRHTYMELISSSGNGFEVGFCGPTVFPFVGTRGAIVSPDPKEAASGFERKVFIEINDEQFNRVFKRIESDKQNGHEYFHIFKNNCSCFVTRICKEELGLKINNQEFLSQAFARKILKFLHIKPSSLTLKVINGVAKVIRVLLSPVYALIWLISGSPFDDKLGKKIKQIQFPNSQLSFKESLKKFFESDYLRPFTGWKISAWQDKVKEIFKSDHVTLEQAMNIKFNDLVSL